MTVNLQKFGIAFNLLLVFFIWAVPPTHLHAQNNGRTTKVKVKGGRFFISADTNFFVKNDSLVIIPIDKDYMVSRYPPLNNADAYKNIRMRSSDNKVVQSLYQLAFVEPEGGQFSAKGELSNASNPYDKYEGKVIRNIRFKSLEPFGPSLSDTAGLAYSWMGRFGNSMHIPTRSYVLKNSLLISSGELVNPLVLSDNEVLIRQLPYINDTRIIVIPIENSDSVDILFITRDKFAFGFSPILKSSNNFSLKVWNENLFGLGHRAEMEFSALTNRDPLIRFESGRYTIQNINGSFIKGDMGYEIIDDQHQYHISFSRGYLPPIINTGLGMSYSRYIFDDYYLNKDSVLTEQDIDLELQNAYIGHAYLIARSPRPERHGIYLTPGLNVIRKYFNKRPYLSPDIVPRYRNTTLFLASLSISQNNFYQSNYFFEFGRTENIPFGYRLNITNGYEIGEYYNRLYSGFTFSAGEFIPNFGFVFAKISLGSYFKDGRAEEGLFHTEFSHASQLFRIRHNNVRIFSRLQYTMGYERLAGDFLRFEGDNGIMGFGSNLLLGQKRLSVTVEPVVFTPWVFLGFRFVFFAYATFGMIGPENKSILDNYVYSGYGLGIRIRNNNLVFNTLELSVGFYPNAPADQNNMVWSMGGIPTPKFENFLPRSPNIVIYR